MDTRTAEITNAWKTIENLQAKVDYYEELLFAESTADAVHRLRAVYGLSNLQAKLVHFLYRAGGRTITKPGIHNNLYGGDPSGGPELKIIDVVVCHARPKLPAGAIGTVWGVGYHLTKEGLAALGEVLSAPIAELDEKLGAYPEMSRGGRILAVLEALKDGPQLMAQLYPKIQASHADVRGALMHATRSGLAVVVDTQPRPGGGHPLAIYGLTPKGRERIGLEEALAC